MSPPAAVARSPFRALFAARGARFEIADGIERAAAVADPAAEARAAREGAGLLDVSAERKWEVFGAGAAAALEPILGAPPPPVGRAVLSRAGGSLLAALRLADDRALLLAEPGSPFEPAAAAGCAHVADATAGLLGLRIAGPRAREILGTLAAIDLREASFPDLACAETGVAKVPAAILRRDLGGLPAFEIYAPRNYADYLGETIGEAGRGRGLALCGTEAERALERGAP